MGKILSRGSTTTTKEILMTSERLTKNIRPIILDRVFPVLIFVFDLLFFRSNADCDISGVSW